MAKPTLPKGTRDFLPLEVIKRKHIFATVESVFKKFGFLPIETPAMEALETLMGKYGEEGDKLLFKILNNGDFLEKADQNALDARDAQKLVTSISKRGLRYDLTVPFARYVVMHQNDLAFPFKRYQIQPVWRADRPQKGRYQEFFQCDVDIVGSDSLLYEAELISIYHEVFKKLNIKVDILINNRKILFGLAEAVGHEEKFMDITIAIDKLDKIGREGVKNELTQRGISPEHAEQVLEMLEIKNFEDLTPYFAQSTTGKLGLEEIRQVHRFIENLGIDDLKFDISLARGLSYYTGCIFEVKASKAHYPSLSMGSIGGGGRYDNLTETFGLKGMSGVGVSFGAERIYDVMEELNLFPKEITSDVQVIFLAMNEEALLKSFQLAHGLRSEGIAVEVYPEAAKLKKQLKYADSRGIPYAILLGEEELELSVGTVRNLATGDQEKVKFDALAKKFEGS